MRSFIGNIIFLAALLLILSRFMSIWTGTAFPIDLVTSTSMQPTLMEGDIVAWTPTTIKDIKVGDVIVFKSYINWPGEKLVVHRVTAIKTDPVTGKPMLETKGDANQWTDQAGPHIPEPYIREDHLVGKTISIGQQPLKIPFVGYIAILINSVLEQLSKPVAAKGYLTYAGVFAPLTISAVILVVLLFLVPEKAKTAKEKLHHYIFGHKPISVKKTIVLFLTAYILFLFIIHCFAYDTATASLGVNADSPQSAINFGRIIQGTTSFEKQLPLINPSITPVKGIAFGKGEIKEHIIAEVFEIERGQSKTVGIRATASNSTANGTYTGAIMIYSSPFWIIFPDDFIKNVCSWNTELTVYILDFLVATVLTLITISIMLIITFTNETYTTLKIDRSWCHTSKIFLGKKTTQRITKIKSKIKHSLSKNIGWIINADITQSSVDETLRKAFVKPVLASLIIIPILFLITDQILVMILATLIAGLTAYLISCKLRSKILLTTVIVATASIIYTMIRANLMILANHKQVIELFALGFGAVGVYLVLLVFLLVPLSFITWVIVRLLRNLKEQKDPLLILEGSCDL
ncbi:MAG: signal peptidase I [Candidatus Thermoplasmatota archaeon]|nr:signal peptidase I [Candidatus Thermoplasmatota archaeon]